MTRSALRSPLAWLAALLVCYLAFPIAAFALRFAGASDRGFHSPGLFPALFVSLESATISLALLTLCGVPLAYLLARSSGGLARAVGVVVQLPLALPPLMAGILLIYVIGPYTFLGRLFGGHLTDSLVGVVLAQTFVAAPFLIVAARAAFETLDPALLDVAATLGHPPVSRFRRVALPLAGPGIRAGMLLAWLRAFGEYGAVVVVAYHPFTLPVYTYDQFSGYGLPTTVAPTALALAVAAVAVALSRLRPRTRRRVEVPPAPVDPPVAPAAPVGFAIDHHQGTFHLSLSHAATHPHLAVVGPSGSGKSTLLRCLAGLHGAGPGPVRYGNRSVEAVAVEARHVGYVAQGFALFPHLTVWQQLLFAVDAQAPTAAYWLEHLALGELRDRYPSELSGGQRQRVALAQALCGNPSLLLLDEPFSALDTPVRRELRGELRRLQRATGLATVVVTHDPEEAALLAEEVLVIDGGRTLQEGPTRRVFSRPASPEVARLLGLPNVRRAVVQSARAITAGGTTIEVAPTDLAPGTTVLFSIRPEAVALSPSGALVGTVTDVADVGTAVELVLGFAGGLELSARRTEPAHPPLVIGQSVGLDLPPAALSLWPTGPPVGVAAAD
jgi:molybdate transport system permease protein